MSTVILSLFTVSCASFPEYKLPHVTDFPGSSTGTDHLPSVHFAVRFLTDLSGGEQPPLELSAPLPRIREIVKNVADESGMLGSYSFEAFNETDYVLQIEITNSGDLGSASAAGFITGLSLFVIPMAVTDAYRFKATLLARNGPVLKTYEYEDALETWFGIWFLPVANNTPQKAFDEIFENMVRTLFRDLSADRAFDSSS